MLIRSCASSANLGPGFDCLGIAWQLYNDIEFELSERDIILGCEEKYCGEDNLALTAYRKTLEYAGAPIGKVKISFVRTDIPTSRGLGSSAALITAAVTAANELNGLGLTKEQLFAIATSIEGHPDNIAPALFGGFTASSMDGEKPVTARFDMSDGLYFTVLIPNFELSTALSRSVLPKSYSRADAVFNISRTALMIKAMESGDTCLMSTALQDRIHQPYRMGLITGAEVAQRLAYENGAGGICISGAGSTLLCISDDENFTDKMSTAMADEIPGWKVISVKQDTEGVRIIE